MLKPKQIDALPQALVELYSQLEMDILSDMARRISGMDLFIPAAQWQYRKLAEMGNCHGWIMQALSAQTGKSRREIERMMEEAGVKRTDRTRQFISGPGYRLRNWPPPPPCRR